MEGCSHQKILQRETSKQPLRGDSKAIDPEGQTTELPRFPCVALQSPGRYRDFLFISASPFCRKISRVPILQPSLPLTIPLTHYIQLILKNMQMLLTAQSFAVFTMVDLAVSIL